MQRVAVLGATGSIGGSALDVIARHPDALRASVLAAGSRVEPAPSELLAQGTIPAATAAAEPPDEPPGPCARFQGLRVGPKARGSVAKLSANSGVFDLPSSTSPAVR